MRHLLVILGGGLGAWTRFLTGGAIMKRFGGSFPLGTLVINVTGSFAVGLLMTMLTERWRAHPYWRLVLVVGFLGGYTTFSTFEYESYRAIREGGLWLGLLNILGSVVLGYVAVWAGSAITGYR